MRVPAHRSTIYLVRHGKAGNRASFHGEDDLRPLTPTGRRQATALAERLASVRNEGPGGQGVQRVLSSPAVRCVSTVAPLAARLGVPVELQGWLREDARAIESLVSLLRAANGSPALVACTHGELIWALLELLTATGLDLGTLPVAPKASVWVLTVADGVVIGARLEQAP